ncbi:hypothetical protein [Leptodesmis sp.]|uniref:hypothetical protein n=1 Tax=Leptodesmis sp. TaxID=3100501 RepID=UPI0040534FBC
MNHTSSSTFLCRHCRYYTPQGRRGGHCNKLNVGVKSQWEACNLVASPFVSTWKDFGDMMLWPQKVLELQEAIMAHTDEATTEELTEIAQSVPVIVVGS